MTDTPDFDALIPELRDWNDGKGIHPESWIGCVGTYELAIGYSLVFWPAFVRAGRYVLREGFSQASLQSFEDQTQGDRRAIEAVMNHLHMVDLHAVGDPDRPDPTEAQLRYLGRTLRDVYAAKLASDFPDLAFEVSFNDEPDLDPLDYQLTFWQVGSERGETP